MPSSGRISAIRLNVRQDEFQVAGPLAQLSNRHHYIPCFYSALWTGDDGRLCQYSRPQSIVQPLRQYPKQVGFTRGLYLLPGLRPENRSVLEDGFFSPADSIAAEAMRYMIEKNTTALPNNLRAGFARLLTGFFHRTPDRIAAIRTHILEELEKQIVQARIDPSTLFSPETISRLPPLERENELRRDVSERAWGILMMDVVDSPMVNTAIMQMGWTICTLENTQHTLMTSDKPLITSNGFAHSEGNLSVALGPRRLFIATNNPKTLNNITRVGSDNLVTRFNQEVVKQARRYVYGADDSQLRFVENRLARKLED